MVSDKKDKCSKTWAAKRLNVEVQVQLNNEKKTLHVANSIRKKINMLEKAIKWVGYLLRSI